MLRTCSIQWVLPKVGWPKLTGKVFAVSRGRDCKLCCKDSNSELCGNCEWNARVWVKWWMGPRRRVSTCLINESPVQNPETFLYPKPPAFLVLASTQAVNSWPEHCWGGGGCVICLRPPTLRGLNEWTDTDCCVNGKITSIHAKDFKIKQFGMERRSFCFKR